MANRSARSGRRFTTGGIPRRRWRSPWPSTLRRSKRPRTTAASPGTSASSRGRVIAPLSTQRGASGVARFAGRLARRPAAGEAFRAPFIAADRQLVKALLQHALHRDELARAADAADVHAQLLETVFACIFLLDGDRHLSWRAGSAHPSWRSCRNENPCPAFLRGRGGAAGAIITALLHARQPETLPQPVEQRGAGVGGGRRSSHR